MRISMIRLAVAALIALGIAAIPSASQAATGSVRLKIVKASFIVGVSGGQGVLLLSANPWADLEKIVSKSDQKEVPITDDSTPASIKLPPGDYIVTVKGPNGTQTIDVNIAAGQRTPKHLEMGGVDYDKLAEEVSKQ